MTNDLDLSDVEDEATHLSRSPEALRQQLRGLRALTMESFDNTQWGNAARFASRHGENFLCDVSERAPRFFTPDETGLWVEDRLAATTRLAGEIVNEMQARAFYLGREGASEREADLGQSLLGWTMRTETRSLLREMAQLAAERYALTVIAEEHFDQHRDLLALPDGRVIELGESDIRIRPIQRSDMITFTTRGTYRPELIDNPPAEVELYLKTFMPDPEFQDRLFKVLGAALPGSNEARLFPIILGDTTCGKSQLTDAIDSALGQYSKAATASILRGNMDDKPRPDILRIVRRRIAFLNEAGDAWDLHGDRVKDLTGGAPVPVRGMRTNTFLDVVPYFTPIIVANKMPTIKDADPAIKRRLLAFEFTKTFEGVEDPTIKKRFVSSQNVYDWLLSRMVRGYLDARRDGLQDVIDAQGLTTMRAYEGLTNVGEFLQWLREDDRLATDEGGSAHNQYVQLSALHDLYTHWLKRHGDQEDQRRRLNLKAFNAQLRNTGWESHKCNSSNHWVGKLVPREDLERVAGVLMRYLAQYFLECRKVLGKVLRRYWVLLGG